MKRTALRVVHLLLCSMPFMAVVAHAQTDYPTKAIRFVLPFPPGSGTDLAARESGNYIARRTGRAVIIENKPGGNGLIAAQQAAQAAPDGHTVFITSMTTQSVNPYLYKKLPYDPVKDFVPVAMLSKSAMVLVVRNSFDQPKSVLELTAKLEAPGEKLSFASGNTSSLVAAETYKRLAMSPSTVHVPYKGNPQAISDLIGGNVDFMFADLTVASPLLKQGVIRALGVTGPERSSILPDVPTMREVGMPIELTIWVGAYVPAKTPSTIINRLNELLNESTQTKEAKERFRLSGGSVVKMTANEFQKFNESELQIWGRAVRAAGIQAE